MRAAAAPAAPGDGLAALGLEPDDERRVRRALCEPLGIVLVAGPRNSGLGATLQALAQVAATTAGSHPQGHGHGGIDREADLVLDPPPAGVVLRSACASASAGRRVFASVHLERAAHVFGQFQAHGTPPALLARDLLLCLAQQRVRRLCRACRLPDPAPELRAVLAQAANSWMAGVPSAPCRPCPGGCPQCAGTGHDGHALAYELLLVDSGVRALAEQGLIGLAMEQALFADGHSLWDSGLRLLARGQCALHDLRAALREPR